MTSKNMQKSLVQMVAHILKRRGVGVLPTDTIYGIVGRAADRLTVERIYKLRKRNPKKPMIILIASLDDLKKFGVQLRPVEKRVLKKLWPGKVSVALQTSAGKKLAYLHRGTGTLAFRMPAPQWLRALLKLTGPLVAPSANFEGKEPARTIPAAKKYFKDDVECYVDMGKLVSRPSTLVTFSGEGLKVLRKGAMKIDSKRVRS